jgi:hypothetical protein
MLPTDFYVVAKINKIMKKYTLLFATLLAMSGMAFGQVLSKSVWANEVDSIAVGASSRGVLPTLSSTTSGKTAVYYNYLLNFNVRKSGIKLYDKNGKIVWDIFDFLQNPKNDFKAYSLNKKYTLVDNYGFDSNGDTPPDTTLLFDEEFNLLRKFNVQSPNSTLAMAEEGVFHNNINEKAIIKYDVKGKEEWRYETSEILRVWTQKPPYLLALKLNSTEAPRPIIILDKNGKKIGQTNSNRIRSVFPSNDKGFWIVNTEFEYLKFDSTGKQTAKYTEFREQYNPIDFTEPVLADNSLLINFRRDDGILLIRISPNGDVKKYTIPAQIKYKDIFTTFTYKVDEIKKLLVYSLCYQASNNQAADLVCKIGSLNLESLTDLWQKTLPIGKTNSIYGSSVSIEEDYTFFHIYTPIDKPSTKRFAVYMEDGVLKWESTFATNSPTTNANEGQFFPWKKVGNFLYVNDIENDRGLGKVNYRDGKIVWRRKDISVQNFSKQLKIEENGRENIMYPNLTLGLYEIALLNSNGTSKSKHTLPSPTVITNSGDIMFVSTDFYSSQDENLILFTQEKKGSNFKYILRKISPCNDLNTITITGKTEACPTEKVKLSIPKEDGLTYQWQKDGKDIPNVKDVVYDFGESGTYTVVAKDKICQNSVTSNALKVTIRTLPNAEITAPKSIFCEGEKTVMTATTSGTFFQWQKDQKDIPNATSGIYEVSEAGNYQVGVRDDKCPQVGYSNVYTIITKLLPEANISTDIKGVVYEPFTVKMTANSGTGLAYQWLKDDVIIPNETSLTYEAKKSGKYQVNVTYDGCTKLSDALTISILIPLANQEEIGEEQVQVYPNPSKGKFKIILPKSLKNADIQVFDSFGRERSLTYTGEQAQAEGLTQGVYFLRVQKGDKSITNKIVIE